MKIKRILLNNFAIKILALILAFVTWVYVGEATKEGSDQTVLQRLLSSSSYGSKKLQIKPVFMGDVPEGFRLVKENVKVNPDSILVVAPSRALPKKEFISTDPIDLSEHTISKTVDVELENLSKTIELQKTKVQVFIPVEKIEKETQAK